MSAEDQHEPHEREDQHEHEGHDHDHPHDHDHDHDHEHPQEHGHDHDHDDDEHHHHGHHDHDHTLIVDRLPAGRWVVDHGSSEVNFRARALLGLLPVSGYFGDFAGEMQIAEDGRAAGSLVVEMATVNTGIATRDEDLRSEKYFDVSGHPQMTFTLESVAPSGHDHLNVRGTLRVRDTDIPLAFPAYAIAHGDHLHLEGRVRIDHHAAGLGWRKPGMVGKSVRADVALTLQPAD